MLRRNKGIQTLYKRGGLYLLGIIVLFIGIGILTTIKPAYRLSSEVITNLTSDIDSSTFLYLLGMENRVYREAYPEDKRMPKISSALLQVATSVKPNDPRSLLGNELPGFSEFDSRILIAGEGTNYTNLPMESSPPLEDVLKDRNAVVKESEGNVEEDKEKIEETEDTPTTGDRDVVYIYNTHNRESFLPHLPGVTDPNQASHKEVNITMVSDRLAESLEKNGIGTSVDDSDIMSILNGKGWGYGKSYDASREVAAEALATNKEIQYVFDLHRDSIAREKTTKKLNGENYARIMFVVGLEHPNHEKNLKVATELHHLIEKKYPGLSRGVITKAGAGVNGIYNQDLTENALLVEVGGVGNNMDELYRSADAIADVFSEFYWDAEKVDANAEGE
ncbi:stage II sporulation protein P [Oceanobacillus sp. M65]|uniref:Stage II sporulation protein P n=1 Tax=Oceanobacillus jordanicus TaxID=2867266 RepID=A0AAW5B3V0_9BACI|nr:stage II sporulation protein P [Oceanobacillus jordanicus]MCG3418648.1 stage II sporulation protein P [Oceanobacillus jordanicus]